MSSCKGLALCLFNCSTSGSSFPVQLCDCLSLVRLEVRSLCCRSRRGANWFADFAELNAPPMINYGVVYPQAIIVFVMTLLYSVVQPLIVIFGAIYFGVAYVVYKYKLLFSKWHPFIRQRIPLNPSSILQALRIAGPSMGHNLYTTDLGCHRIPGIHDWDIRTQEGIHYFFVGDTPPYWDGSVVVVHHQDLRPAEQTC